MSRQPDFSTVRRPRSLWSWERLAWALGVAALVLVALAAQRARGEAQGAAVRLAEAKAEVERLAEQRSSATRRRAASGGAAPASSPARVVAAIASALPRDARLERLAIDYTRGVTIEMQVLARSASAWDRLLDRLEKAQELREVAPGAESRTGEVRSVVRARWAGGGPR